MEDFHVALTTNSKPFLHGQELLTTLEANLYLVLVIALKNSSELTFEERKQDSVDDWRILPISFPLFALNKHELSLQRNIPPTSSHSLSHPP